MDYEGRSLIEEFIDHLRLSKHKEDVHARSLCSLLFGVTRAMLLAAPARAAREKVITLKIPDVAEDFVFCDAVLGPLRAVLD